MRPLLAVFGNPISQSKSPYIHQCFSEQVGIKLQYIAKLGSLDSIGNDFDLFFENERSLGANVTMPFKEHAAKWVDEITVEAESANSVNTIIRKGQKFIGDSTDGVGLINDLLRLEMEIRNKNILIIGAGGAARGVFRNIINQHPKSIDILNRTLSNAQTLSEVTKNSITRCISAQNDLTTYDLIINATSLSLEDRLPTISKSQIHQNTNVYDMVYKNCDTCFVDWARQAGCKKASDGLGMLVGQAAESFHLWFNEYPTVEPVIEQLRQKLKQG